MSETGDGQWEYDAPDGVPVVRITDRNLLFLKHYTETASLLESMRRAGYEGNDDTLRTNGYHLLRRLHTPLPALMRAQGLTIPAILQTVEEARKAHKVTRIKMKEAVVVTDDKGEEHQSVQDVIREFDDIDHPTRLKACDIALRLYGLNGRHSPTEPDARMGNGRRTDLMPFIGTMGEEDAEAEEEQERQTQSEAELRSDINEIKRKLKLIGYDLVPLASAKAED